MKTRLRRSTEKISQIIKGDGKKVEQIKRHHQLKCNCLIKTQCRLNDNCCKGNMIYQCTALTTLQPKRLYLAETYRG